MTERLFHLAIAAEWDAALGAGSYERSTIGCSLADEGFIHASFSEQVQATADRFYRGRDDVVLLTIDVARLELEPVVEDLTGSGEAFPHLYGPLPVEAVADVRSLRCGADGRLEVGDLPRC